MRKKEHEIVSYINRQRSHGHSNDRIRLQMELRGHTPEKLNEYFQKADAVQKQGASLLALSLVVLLFAVVAGVLAVGLKTPTGAAMSDWFTATTYSCGDDYPAKAKNVKDLSDCVADSSSTKSYLFCYVNNTESSDEISPDESNDDWYLSNLLEDISLISFLGSAELLESSIIFPWTASYDNADCFSWTHGTTRSEDWHECNATKSASIEPPNLVFYYTDAADGSGNVSYGGISTELNLNSSYYMCYDELNCTTSTTSCDEDAGWHCVGRLDDTSGSSWYPCDTVLDADYYRCCKGGCEGIEMECGEYVGADTRSAVAFDECKSDGTSGCCSASTDCVYDSECYSEDETITYIGGSLGVGSGMFGGGVEANTTEYTFVCSDSHWCPEGFSYSSRYQLCEPMQAACYDASNADYCNYIFGTDDIDVWEADTEGVQAGCINPSTSGTRYYNESCVYSGTYGVTAYYFYKDITWY